MNKLLVNADDFGYSEAVNDAIVYGILNGLIDRTTIMVNMPFCEDAVNKAIKYGFESKVGLHLNVVEGKTLTEPIKKTILCNAEGLFDDEIMKKPVNRLFLDVNTKKALELEIEEQIKRYLEFGIGQKHIDSHRHAHVAPSIFPVVMHMAKKYEFKSIRLARNIPKSELGVFKLMLKNHINREIMRINHNDENSGYPVIHYFGSMKDIEKQLVNGLSINGTELMVHPIVRDGKFCDAIEQESVEEWLTRLEVR